MKLTSLLLTVLFALVVTACSSNQKKTQPGNDLQKDNKAQVDSGNNNGLNLEVNGDSDSNRAGSLKTVYFDFNSASLSESTKESLASNAKFLNENKAVKVQVEGHADERGGVQFNLALGEKRAKGVREYLIAHGVEGARITTISFGKERPVAFGHDEEAWSKNRRANFVIIAK